MNQHQQYIILKFASKDNIIPISEYWDSTYILSSTLGEGFPYSTLDERSWGVEGEG